MLNLKIAMTPLTFLSGLLLGLHLLIHSVSASGDVLISYPEAGEVVDGLVGIRGTVPSQDFASAKVAYSYMGDVDDWFLIARIEQPLEDGLLASWDTTTITDGIYQIRLTVKTTDGSKIENIVKDLRVANDSHLVLQPKSDGEVIKIQSTPTDNLTSVMPTALPANPAAIDDNLFNRSILIGGLSGVGTVIVFVLWKILRNHLNR
jgi:hypothetical protein